MSNQQPRQKQKRTGGSTRSRSRSTSPIDGQIGLRLHIRTDEEATCRNRVESPGVPVELWCIPCTEASIYLGNRKKCCPSNRPWEHGDDDKDLKRRIDDWIAVQQGRTPCLLDDPPKITRNVDAHSALSPFKKTPKHRRRGRFIYVGSESSPRAAANAAGSVCATACMPIPTDMSTSVAVATNPDKDFNGDENDIDDPEIVAVTFRATSGLTSPCSRSCSPYLFPAAPNLASPHQSSLLRACAGMCTGTNQGLLAYVSNTYRQVANYLRDCASNKEITYGLNLLASFASDPNFASSGCMLPI
eukprot:scaffold192013_cov60-Attheya_sp.AAC.1